MALAWNPSIGVPMLIVGVVVWGMVYLFGRPKQEQQGRRRPRAATPAARDRREPVFGAGAESGAEDPLSMPLDPAPPLAPLSARGDMAGEGLRAELERLGATLAGDAGVDKLPTMSAHRPSSGAQAIIEALRSPSLPPEQELDLSPVAPAPIPPPASAPAPPVAAAPAPAETVAVAPATLAAAAIPAAPAPVPPRRAHADIGKRPAHLPIDRIVSLYVVAREGRDFAGSDLIVAAEKAGLEFGDMNIYHRLQDGKRDQGPVFSVANMLKPGSFDLAGAASLRSPGLSFFMTLPAPVPALDAWDAMLPTAQRMAELLDGLVLDEERNALGRQRIAHIREELRFWDRDHDHEYE